MIRRACATLLTTFALVLAMASPAAAGGGSNIVVANNDDATREMARSALKVVTDADGKVDEQNLAYSRSHDCTGCRTLAAAFEVVLVPNSPTQVTPANVAAAVNERCSSCATFAAAHQYVVQTAGPSRLSRSARGQVADLQEQVAQAIRSGQDFPTIDARLDDLANQLWDIVNRDVTAQGGAPTGTPTKG